MTTTANMRDLADDLEMFASQIREAAEDRRNHPPTVWRIEDWLARYESCFKAHHHDD